MENGKKDKGDFGEGSIPSTMMRLALPIILAELVQVLYNLVDRMYIGHIPSCGTEALTGIGISLPLVTVITAFANLCSHGGAPLCAIARGEKDDTKAQRILENTFTLIVLAGILLTVFFYSFRYPLLSVMGADEATLVYSVDYFEIYVFGTVFTLVSLGMNSFINMQGNSVIGMWTVLIGAIANIVLDPLFIFVFSMGVKGAAIATVISQFLSALWVFAFFRGKKAMIRFDRFRLETNTVRSICSLGVSGFCFKATNAITQAVANITLRAFGGALGTLYIGSMSIINSLRDVVQQPIMGIIDGAKPIMSYNYGALKYDRVDRTIAFMVKITFFYNLAIWVLMQTIPSVMVRIFTSDEALISVCSTSLRIYFAAFALMCFQTCGQNVFVALNHPGYAVFFSLLRKVVLVVPFTLILPRLGLGAPGVFWAEAVSQVTGAACCFTTMYFKVWRPIKARCKLNVCADIEKKQGWL